MSRLPDPLMSQAVLIGVSHCADAERWPALPSVESNVTDLRDALTNPRLWGLPAENCTTLLNPTDPGPVLEAVNTAARTARDTVLVYYAGHGSTTDADLLLTLASTTSDNLLFRALRYSTARDIIQQRRATHAVVLLDSCFSGMAHPMADVASFVDRQLAVTSAYTLTSSARDAISLAPPGERHTAFTGALLTVLANGLADAPESLSLGAVSRAVTRTLVDRRYPAPSHSQSGLGDQLALVKNVQWQSPRTAPTITARRWQQPSVGYTPKDLAIKIVGVGGAGMNAVDRMVEFGLSDVEFIAVNTDDQALMMSDAQVKLSIGRELVRGLGAGADPETGRKAAELSTSDLENLLRGSQLVFVACGEGGGTGTGGAPVVASVARRLGALTIGVVTRPFAFEGRRRAAQAERGVTQMNEVCDTIIVIPNDRVLAATDRQASMLDAFRAADQVLLDAVAALTDLIVRPGLISIGYGAVRQMLTDAGPALIGIGTATGTDRALTASRQAIGSPLIEHSVEGARGVIISVSGDATLTYDEVEQAVGAITSRIDPEAHIIFGASLDSTLGPTLKITVIALASTRNTP
ncbi:cell division protein FtsZ [Streptomyces canus]|uniref:cell division protein FtsZ n=1 Tax=Streptomyces canus TaxID=58343 RepID=UPI0036A22222